jgi:hypothetical protein
MNAVRFMAGHGLDPQRNLTGGLASIAPAPVSEVRRFLPDVWKGGDAGHD